ncbi:MAG: hypothetical protein ACOX1M_03900 [Erysipelotrichaceae bacterium]|jgi:hypothetical protein
MTQKYFFWYLKVFDKKIKNVYIKKKIVIIDNISSLDKIYFVTNNMFCVNKDVEVISEIGKFHNSLNYVNKGVLIECGYKEGEEFYVTNIRNEKYDKQEKEKIEQIYNIIKKEIKRK